jgi:hypothetical protein
MQTTFKTTCKISIFFIEEFLNLPKDSDLYYDDATCTVYWSVEPEMREFGIKSMNMVVQRVVASIEWENKNDDGEAIGSGEIQIDTTIMPDWKIKDNFEFGKDGQIYPTDCEVDLKSKIIEIS